MKTVNIKDIKFKDSNGLIFGFSGTSGVYAIEDDNGELLSYDGFSPYIPAGGKAACNLLCQPGVIDTSKMKTVKINNGEVK